MMKLKTTDTMMCPHCEQEQEGCAGDYVVKDKMVEEECIECYKIFYTELYRTTVFVAK